MTLSLSSLCITILIWAGLMLTVDEETPLTTFWAMANSVMGIPTGALTALVFILVYHLLNR